MLKKAKHGILAVAVFAGLTLCFLWLSGAMAPLRAKPAGAAPAAGAAHEEAAGAKHEGEKDACCEKEGEAKEEAEKPLTLAEIEAKKCEHGIQQIDCDECRYELGVVKVEPSVTGALVETGKAEQRELAQKLRVTGEVQLDQTRVVDVVPVAAGRLIAIKAQLGDQVKAGQTLAILHSSEFGEAKAAYLEAVAAHEIAVQEQAQQSAVNAGLEKMLAQLKQSPAGASEAQPVGKQPLGEWRSKLIGASARLQKARVAHDREKNLVEKQASSRAEFEEALRELQTAQAEFDALVEEVQLNLGLNKLRADGAARQAEARLNAAEQRLHLLGLDDEAVKSVAGADAHAGFAQVEIKAPRAGTITAQAASEGRYVDTTHSLFTIADLSNVWVWCDVYERDLAALHAILAKDGAAGATRASVTVPAYPDARFAGMVDLVGSALDEHTRTLKVRVQLANPQGQLKAGMFATVEIELPGGQPVTVVPRQAILSDAGQSFAFVHWRDDLWLKRVLTVGRSQDGVVEVEGLKSGDTVAIGGAFLLKSDVLRAKMGAGCAD